MIIGIDVGSETHFARAFNWRGYEFSRKPLEFSNTEEGFETFRTWIMELKEKHGMDKVIPGMEPTDHYWYFNMLTMKRNGIREQSNLPTLI